jgi:hypothetical protein
MVHFEPLHGADIYPPSSLSVDQPRMRTPFLRRVLKVNEGHSGRPNDEIVFVQVSVESLMNGYA